MSGQAAFDKPVRPAALCRGGTAENGKAERGEETELNGVEEGRDEMSDEEGGEIDGEEELAAPDWRVRAGPRSKPTQRERVEHEATHVPFRDWCAHCMMGRGRTHHHVAKQKSEDQSRRPIIAMDYFFMRMECSPKCPGNLRGIKNLHCSERRQTSEHHEQRCAEERSRRAVDDRKGGQIH